MELLKHKDFLLYSLYLLICIGNKECHLVPAFNPGMKGLIALLIRGSGQHYFHLVQDGWHTSCFSQSAFVFCFLWYPFLSSDSKHQKPTTSGWDRVPSISLPQATAYSSGCVCVATVLSGIIPITISRGIKAHVDDPVQVPPNSPLKSAT